MKIPKLEYKGQRKDLHPGANWMYKENVMEKSGVQGLAYDKQQKILTTLKKRKSSNLTYAQCKKIDAWLDEKEEMIYNRFNNKIELKRLKAMKVDEKDRMRMHESIEKGENMINKQTRAISKLSINAISMRLKMPYERIEYYANKQKFVK